MTPELWSEVDDYIAEKLIPVDPVFDAVLKACADAGLPPHQVSSAQGKFLHLLARIKGARTVLEIGTLGAYSTIWLARALSEEGKLITLEAEPRHAEVARANIERAGTSDRVEVRLGPARASLVQLAAEKRGPFDLVFIDADKASTADYFAWALEHSRPGTLLIADNTVRNGGLADATSDDPSILGIRRFHEALRLEPRVSATTLQTVGNKGYDGFTLVLVIA